MMCDVGGIKNAYFLYAALMISKGPINISNFRNGLYFYNSAREAWLKILEQHKIITSVLLPSYIGITEREGSGIFDPILQINCQYEFYDLNPDLSINLDSIFSKIKTGKFNIVLVVHYFGLFQQDLHKIIKECRQQGILVVEDCAHFMNINSVCDLSAIQGDAAFYSLHKILPISTGGLLVLNSKNKENFTKGHFESTWNENEFACFNLGSIKKIRRDNYLIYEDLISQIVGIRIFKPLSGNDVPHNFPILVENGFREKLYFWLMGQDMPVISLYYRLIEPLNNDRFIGMQNISASILNLPVHQDTEKDDIIHLCNKIKDFCGNENT